MGNIKDAVQSCFKQKDRRPIYEWAAGGKLKLPRCLTKHGNFSSVESRHFEAPLDDYKDERCREINVLKPTRGGGSLLSDIITPWAIENEPGPFRFAAQNPEISKQHAEIRSIPILKSVDTIRDLLPADRHKDRKGGIILANGIPLYWGGVGKSEMQNKGYRHMHLDEPWLYEDGETIGDIKARVGDFLRLGLSKLLFISQAGREGLAWHRQCLSGQWFDWAISCVGCSHVMPLRDWVNTRPDGSRWGMRWDEHKDEHGFWQIEKVLPTVRFECEKCGYIHIDGARVKSEWNRTGKYVMQKDGDPRVRTRHWNAIIADPWEDIVKHWLEARNASKQGIYDPVIQFYQKRMAEFKSEMTVRGTSQAFHRVYIDVKSEWKDEKARYLTFDRQEEDVFWYMIRAWGQVGRMVETRRLAIGKCYSFDELEEKRKEFNVWPNRVLGDSGYRPKGDNGVYSACVRYGWIALKGTDNQHVFYHHEKQANGHTRTVSRSYSKITEGDPESGTTNEGKRHAPLIHFASNVMADRLDGLIEKGYWKEPPDDGSELEQEHKRQMAAEYKKMKENKFTHKIDFIRVCPSGNNHLYDCAKEQVAAATISGILPDLLNQEKKEEATTV